MDQVVNVLVTAGAYPRLPLGHDRKFRNSLVAPSAGTVLQVVVDADLDSKHGSGIRMPCEHT